MFINNKPKSKVKHYNYNPVKCEINCIHKEQTCSQTQYIV